MQVNWQQTAIGSDFTFSTKLTRIYQNNNTLSGGINMFISIDISIYIYYI